MEMEPRAESIVLDPSRKLVPFGSQIWSVHQFGKSVVFQQNRDHRDCCGLTARVLCDFATCPHSSMRVPETPPNSMPSAAIEGPLSEANRKRFLPVMPNGPPLRRWAPPPTRRPVQDEALPHLQRGLVLRPVAARLALFSSGRRHSGRCGARGMVPRRQRGDRFIRASAPGLPTRRQTRLHKRGLNASSPGGWSMSVHRHVGIVAATNFAANI
jgi:hypothetical protein